MSTALRWHATITARTPKSQWVVATGAFCTLIIALISGGATCVTHESSIPRKKPSVPDNLSNAGEALTIPSALVDAASKPTALGDVGSSKKPITSRASSQSAERVAPKTDLQDNRELKENSANARTVAKMIPSPKNVKRRSRRRYPRKRRVFRAKILKPSTAHEVLGNLQQFPLATPGADGGLSEASSRPSVEAAPAYMYYMKKGEYGRGEITGHESTQAAASGGTAAAVSPAGEQLCAKDPRSRRQEMPAHGLYGAKNVGFTQTLEGRKQGEESGKRGANGALEGVEQDEKGRRTDDDDKNKSTHGGRGETTRRGEERVDRFEGQRNAGGRGETTGRGERRVVRFEGQRNAGGRGETTGRGEERVVIFEGQRNAGGRREETGRGEKGAEIFEGQRNAGGRGETTGRGEKRVDRFEGQRNAGGPWEATGRGEKRADRFEGQRTAEREVVEEGKHDGPASAEAKQANAKPENKAKTEAAATGDQNRQTTTRIRRRFRRRGAKGAVGQGSLRGAFGPEQKEVKEGFRPVQIVVSVPAHPRASPSKEKRFLVWKPVSHPHIMSESSGITRQPSYGRDSGATPSEGTQVLKDESGAKGLYPRSKGPNTRGGRYVKNLDRSHLRGEWRLKNTYPGTFPPPLPPTSNTVVPSSSVGLWTYTRKSPGHSWGGEATANRSEVSSINLMPSSAGLLSTSLTDPVWTVTTFKGRGRGHRRSPAAATSYFEAWPSGQGTGDRQPPAQESESHIGTGTLPLLPSTTGSHSVASLTARTSDFYGGRWTIFRPTGLTDATEPLARYVEPAVKQTCEEPSDDEEAHSHSGTTPEKRSVVVSSLASLATAARTGLPGYTRTFRGEETSRSHPEGRRNAKGASLRRRGRKKQLVGQNNSAGYNDWGRHTRQGGPGGTTIRWDKKHRRRRSVPRERLSARRKKVWRKTQPHRASNAARDPARQHPDAGLIVDSREGPNRPGSRAPPGNTRAEAKQERSRGSKTDSHNSKRIQVAIPPNEQLVVDHKARAELGRRAERLMRRPLIERSSTVCIDAVADFLTPGTKITFEPLPQTPVRERFAPMKLIWGRPLGAGANGIVYEVTGRTHEGAKVRFALKLTLSRHQNVCNAWTRHQRGELTSEEMMLFDRDVKTVSAAEYEVEMKQRRLLSLPRPSPTHFSHREDVGKLFAENQVCVPAAVGRIRGFPNYFVCPGGCVALVNVAGLTPAASCNLFQILEAYNLSMAEKHELTRQVITAMSRLHALGLLHKDLKSENLVVTSKGRVIVADLAGAEPIISGATEPYERFDPGTVTFVAPERAASRLGRPGASGLITMKANAWSLGMMVYEIWCRGKDPFNLESLTDEEVLKRLDSMLERPRALSFKTCPPVPVGIQKLIKALLQPDPRYRKVPVYFLWTHPLLRKAKFLFRSGTSAESRKHR